MKTALFSEKMLGLIAMAIILIGYAFLAWAGKPDTTNARIEDLMFLVATYFFGSSRSGATKDATIANLAQNPQPIVGSSDTTNIKTNG